MPQPLFELLSAAIIVLSLALMARHRAWRALLLDYGLLALSGWMGEQSSISLYHFYHYDPRWHGWALDVPILVPLIWPIVILSARDVAKSLWPRARRALPLLVAAVVAFDASLVEVVAVRAGLWGWAEPGHLNVPIIGILGWAYFALGAAWGLEHTSALKKLWTLLTGPLSAHLLILTTWWGFFRWTVRGDLGLGSMLGIGLCGLIALAFVIRARQKGHGMPMSVAGPRMVAAGLFFALLLCTAPFDGPLWGHVWAIAIPYFASTRFATARYSPAGQDAAKALSQSDKAQAAQSQGA